MAELETLYRDIATLPAKQRLDRIIARKDTMRAVRRMPVLDLYATLREVGVEDALEVVELMSPAQVQGVLDLDGWRKDRVDPTAMAQWMKWLFAANAERAVGQLRGLDIELLTLLIKMHCRVYDLTLDEQPDEGSLGRHTLTPDQRFLIAFGGLGDDETQATVQHFLERLMARDMLFVLRLCESLRWELPSSLEEEALRWRHARMADLGFLPAEEAAAVFAWIDPDRTRDQHAPPSQRPPPAADDAVSTDLTTSPLLPWSLLDDGSQLLSRVLKALDDVGADRVRHELMLTSNRVHIADGQDTGDSDALKATARHVMTTAGIGLAYLAAGDEARAVVVLAQTNVLHLFRVGHSLSLKLRTELKTRTAKIGSGLNGRGLLRLDAQRREVVAGFLRVRPLLFAGLIDERRVDYRPVESLAELAAAAAALTEAAFRAALLERLGATDDQFTDVDDAELPSHSALLAAWLSRASADHDTALAALDDTVRAFAPLPGAVDGDAVVARARAYAQLAASR